MLLEKCSKRGDLLTSQNSENGVPVQAGVHMTVIREGTFGVQNCVVLGVHLAALRHNVGTKGDQKSISKGSKNRAL